MKQFVQWMGTSTATLAVVTVLLAQAKPQDPKPVDEPGGPTKEAVEHMLGDWSGKAREAAQRLINKYGPPEEATKSMLVWRDNGPWRGTIAYKKEVSHHFPSPHKDMVEQFVDCRVPLGMFDELAQFNGSVVCDRTRGLISARCDREELNFLSINLARDVMDQKKSVAEAREYYARAALELESGKKDPYTQGFQTKPTKDETGDPDEPVNKGGGDKKEGGEKKEKPKGP